MSEKKWPILDNRKDQLYKMKDMSSKGLEKPQLGLFSVLDTLGVTNSVNSGNGRPKFVCHLFSICEHASITSKSYFNSLFKTAISVGPVPPILNFTGRVIWTGAVLGRFVRAVGSVQYLFYL